MPPLTITIATLNRREILEKTLWYVYETCHVGVEADLWVWDNGSTDDTPAFLGTLRQWPGVRCFRSDANLGIAGPRRKMLPHIATPYTFTLDDDTWMLTQGWASAVSRALEADPSVHMVGFATTYHPHSDYGSAHTNLDKPFFHVPPVLPRPRVPLGDIWVHRQEYRNRNVDLNGALDEVLVVPMEKRFLPPPFTCSGTAAAWRTTDVRHLIANADRHPCIDLREAWSEALPGHEAMILGYDMMHLSPGALWHLGYSERYWEDRCRMAEPVYNRSSAEQRSWLERARSASGWGTPLETL